jgi:hypothetical protein
MTQLPDASETPLKITRPPRSSGVRKATWETPESGLEITAGRCVVMPPALLSAGQPGESNHRLSRRPTRCIAMRCRPHRERAHLPPAGSSWIVAALAPSSAVRTARPVTPTVKLVAVTARGEQEPRPGRLDAAEARGRTPGRPGCRPGAQAPRRSGGRAPARAYPSSGAPAGGRAPERGCDCPARPPPAVTLSDAGGQGECARSRRSAWSPRLDSSVLGLRKVG